MSSDERLTAIFRDQNRQNFILEMIKADCQCLVKLFSKQYLMQVFENYEEFMIQEINKLFEQCNSFDEIVLTHQGNFLAFVQYVKENVDLYEMPTPPKRVKLTEDFYVIYITMQEWLLRGARGQHFYSMLNIDAFNFDRQFNPPITKTVALTVFRHLVDGYRCISNTIFIRMYHFQFTGSSSKWFVKNERIGCDG